MKHRDMFRTVDSRVSKANCTNPSNGYVCQQVQHGCPRHQPAMYARLAAEHRTDGARRAVKGRDPR